MYYVESNSNKDGVSTFVFRIKQYTQCELGNHLTSEIKETEQFNLKPDAIRQMHLMIAESLTRSNVTVLKASQTYAKVHYAYTNGDETVEYRVKSA